MAHDLDGERSATAGLSRRHAVRGIGGASLAASAILGSSFGAAARQPADARAIVEEILRRFNEGDIDGLGELVTEDMTALWPWPLPGSGAEYVLRGARALKIAFPDGTVALDDPIVEGDRAAVRVTTTGTNDGPLFVLPPTGRRVTLTGLFHLRFADGRVAECVALVDTLALLLQVADLSRFTALLAPPRAGITATPADDAGAVAAAESLLAVEGVAFALVFGDGGEVLAYRSRVDIPQSEVDDIAAFGPVALGVSQAFGDTYSRISTLDWASPEWLVYSGATWTVVVAGNRVVFAETAALDFNALRAQLTEA